MIMATAGSENEMSPTFHSENYSSEDITASAQPGTVMPSYLTSYKIAVLAIGVSGILTNGLVLVAFCFASRSKMNASSFHIANHTTLELFRPTCSWFSWPKTNSHLDKHQRCCKQAYSSWSTGTSSWPLSTCTLNTSTRLLVLPHSKVQVQVQVLETCTWVQPKYKYKYRVLHLWSILS